MAHKAEIALCSEVSHNLTAPLIPRDKLMNHLKDKMILRVRVRISEYYATIPLFQRGHKLTHLPLGLIDLEGHRVIGHKERTVREGQSVQFLQFLGTQQMDYRQIVETRGSAYYHPPRLFPHLHDPMGVAFSRGEVQVTHFCYGVADQFVDSPLGRLPAMNMRHGNPES